MKQQHILYGFAAIICTIILVFSLPCLMEPYTTMNLATQSASDDTFTDNSISLKDVGGVMDMSGNQTDLSPFPFQNVTKRYDPYNYDVTYHELDTEGEFYDTNLSTLQVLDYNGNMVSLPYSSTQSLPVYYNIKKHPYGMKRVTPTYRETVMMQMASKWIVNGTI